MSPGPPRGPRVFCRAAASPASGGASAPRALASRPSLQGAPREPGWAPFTSSSHSGPWPGGGHPPRARPLGLRLACGRPSCEDRLLTLPSVKPVIQTTRIQFNSHDFSSEEVFNEGKNNSNNLDSRAATPGGAARSAGGRGPVQTRSAPCIIRVHGGPFSPGNRLVFWVVFNKKNAHVRASEPPPRPRAVSVLALSQESQMTFFFN